MADGCLSIEKKSGVFGFKSRCDNDIDDGADAINAAVAGCRFIRSSGWVDGLSGELMEATGT